MSQRINLIKSNDSHDYFVSTKQSIDSIQRSLDFIQPLIEIEDINTINNDKTQVNFDTSATMKPNINVDS